MIGCFKAFTTETTEVTEKIFLAGAAPKISVLSVSFVVNAFYFFVLKLNGRYSGQKARTAVSRKTAPSTTSTMPNVPVTMPPKYK